MKLSDLKSQLLKNTNFKNEYFRYDLAFEIGQMILEARIVTKMTQKKLAELIGTKQSGIARLESGKRLPSLTLLEKVAKAFNTNLRVSLDILEKTRVIHVSSSETANHIFILNKEAKDFNTPLLSTSVSSQVPETQDFTFGGRTFLC